jgi:hypothetical protein
MSFFTILYTLVIIPFQDSQYFFKDNSQKAKAQDPGTRHDFVAVVCSSLGVFLAPYTPLSLIFFHILFPMSFSLHVFFVIYFDGKPRKHGR